MKSQKKSSVFSKKNCIINTKKVANSSHFFNMNLYKKIVEMGMLMNITEKYCILWYINEEILWKHFLKMIVRKTKQL